MRPCMLVEQMSSKNIVTKNRGCQVISSDPSSAVLVVTIYS